MAKFRAEEADNYGGQGGGGFFGIQNDKEVKQIRFMYNSVDDVEGMSVHKVDVGDKKRYVNCLREYNDPIEKCPFCAEHIPVQARLFIPVYNIAEDAVQIWDRGKTMFPKITSICSRYASDKNLVNSVFEVERNGKPGDQKTTYEIFKISDDNTEIEDLPEIPQVLGGLVLEKNADEMEHYLQYDEFPDNGNSNNSDRRVDRRVERRGERVERTDNRRTPTSNRRRNEDTF